MTERIQALLSACLAKEQKKYRKPFDLNLVEQYRSQPTHIERMTKRLELLFASETPVVNKNQKIVLQRTITDVPSIFSEEEFNELHAKHFFHELGYLSNICPDYSIVIRKGFGKIREEIAARREKCVAEGDNVGILQLDSMLKQINTVAGLCERYKAEAQKVGNETVVKVLSNVPEKAAASFNEALQFFRILHYTIWAEGEYHNTIGRFDQFMFPYFEADIKNGVLTEDEAFELLEEFFIHFNLDSDKYPGVQQGDDGQSMMLGGVTRDGKDAYNRLTELCMKASGELLMIDPKINLRVDKNTPHERYVAGTHLTKAGLGFPQYSNDDVVIPGLVKLGYELEDARDYTVAACWEYIIPGIGMDIPNIGALNFPKVIVKVLNEKLTSCKTMDELVGYVKEAIKAECDKICTGLENLYIFPAPFMSLLMEGTIEKARDITLGAKYNNFGFHGTGIATATDSLASIEQHVFNDKDVTAEEMLAAMKNNFEGNEALKNELRYATPKMGNDNDEVDKYSVMLLDTFADALKGRTNERGGIFRAGTGSAMFYLRHADEISATPDGRCAKEPFGTNYSPNLFSKVDGPLSVIKSFTKQHLENTINGGPLTMEFHSSIFDTDEGIEKTARLVEAFVALGGHQMQLNAVNRDVLKAAQKNPENYQNLIVRIWGWSAYFCELDKEYQDHVIARCEYGADSKM